MISSVCWVPKGAAKSTPITAEPTEEELEAMKAAALKAQESRGEVDEESSDEDDDWEDDEASEGEEGMEEAVDPVEQARAVAAALGVDKGKKKSKKKNADALADGLAELDMDKYDDEDEQAETERLFGNGGLGNAQYISSEDDPYITLKGDDDSEEIDDFTIRDTDLLLLTARNEDDVSNIEVWVYEEGKGDDFDNLYVHHDVMLPAFPLALAWMDCNPAATAADASASKGNMVAVGTLAPEIEIWDLDVLDAVEPVQILGGFEDDAAAPAEETATSEDGKKKKKKSKKKKRDFKEGSHTDSVLGLAWNAEFRNVLASCSADKTIKAWDITTGKCEHTLSHHTDKVQTVVWNPTEPTVLLSGSFDKTAAVVDMRSPQHPALTWQVSADVECAAWDPHAPQYFVVSTEDGLVRCHDVRKGRAADGASSSEGAGEGALFTLAAHDKPTCSLAFNPAVPNFLATASTDKTVKLWDTTGHRPAMLASKNPKVGAVFSVSFCKDAPHLLASGGSKGELNVWDVLDTAAVARRFSALGPQRAKKEKPAASADIEED